MKSILTALTGSKARFAFIATFIASIFVFVVVPALPNIGSDTMTDGFSVSALVSFAQDSGGGSGGGDAGTGCCGGDTGGDTGTGDGGGDVGTGCCDGGGTTDPGTGGDSGGSTPVLSCTLTINPESITTGSSATVSWTTGNATSVSITNLGAVALNGSRTISPTTNTTYTLTATGAGGTVTCTDSITVIPVVVVNPPVCALIAAPGVITTGQSSSLSWTTQNATNVSLNQNIGAVSANGTRSVSPITNTTYTLTATGAGGTVTCSVPVVITPVVVVGQCILEITKSVDKTTALIGDTLVYTLNFKNNGTANCTGGGVRVMDFLPVQVEYQSETHTSNVTAGYGSAPVYDSAAHLVTWNADILTPGETGSATITVKVKQPAVCGNYAITNKGKVSSAEYNNFGTWIYSNVVTTNVTNACVQALPVCTLTGAPSTITRGGSALLAWTTSNATNVSLDQSIGVVAQNGDRSVSPTTNTTYTLTATGAGGSVTCVKTITVEEPEVPQPLTCDAFTAAPGTLSSLGTTTLTWATSNATAVSIDNGVGIVAVDGTRSVSVNANTTYTLTATRGTETKTCTVPVSIVPNVVVPRCDTFTISPNSVRSGNAVTLAWETTNATAVSIDQGVGSVSADGSRSVTVDANRTYVLTATNGTANTSCQATVSIESDGGGGGGGGGSSSPRCTLKASDEKIKAGEKVTLSWKNTRTNEILLKDNRGNELIDTEEIADEKKYNEDADSIDVRPTKSTSYTLTAYKGSKKRTCTVDIQVENISVTSTRSNTPLVAGISLSNVPYTGFDAGPFLTTVFYTLLVLWALAVAYILVIRREPVLGVSLQGSRTAKISESKNFTNMIEPSVSIPTMTVRSVRAPEVSRMAYIPSIMTPPRLLPRGDMASKYAPVGYEALYEGYGETAPVALEEVPIPENLPVGEPFVATDDSELLETRAHDAYVLISTDALNFIQAQSLVTAERTELLDVVISAAKAHYPKEDGWVVVNKERILSLLK